MCVVAFNEGLPLASCRFFMQIQAFSDATSLFCIDKSEVRPRYDPDTALVCAGDSFF